MNSVIKFFKQYWALWAGILAALTALSLPGIIPQTAAFLALLCSWSIYEISVKKRPLRAIHITVATVTALPIIQGFIGGFGLTPGGGILTGLSIGLPFYGAIYLPKLLNIQYVRARQTVVPSKEKVDGDADSAQKSATSP